MNIEELEEYVSRKEREIERLKAKEQSLREYIETMLKIAKGLSTPESTLINVRIQVYEEIISNLDDANE